MTDLQKQLIKELSGGPESAVSLTFNDTSRNLQTVKEALSGLVSQGKVEEVQGNEGQIKYALT